MLTAQLKQNFKADVVFSGWTDSLKIATSRQRKNCHKTVVGEYKDPNSTKKIQVITANGANIRFMEGNQIISETFWATVFKDQHFEEKVTDFLGLPFAQGREVYRSLMVVLLNNC